MLYIHVPFCSQRCVYCDFYTTTKGEEVREQYVSALCEEIRQRAGELPSSYLETIYLGGGTPSLLKEKDFSRIFETIQSLFIFDTSTEITVESNPDDISSDYIEMLCQFGVNRLSMGVQTFNASLLRFLHRRHSKQQALDAIKNAQKGGIENISIDLIYGLPNQTLKDWENDLRIALEQPITHLSAYSLTYEEGTPLYRLKEGGYVQEAEEGLSFKMYKCLLDHIDRVGWEHYEISNFAKRGWRSRHNSAYWKGYSYLGCGPAAHSFIGRERRYNLPSIDIYNISCGNPPYEIEELGKKECINELILTSLRTIEGIDLKSFEDKFGGEELKRVLQLANKHIRTHYLLHEGNKLRLSRDGFFISDDIISDLMML